MCCAVYVRTSTPWRGLLRPRRAARLLLPTLRVGMLGSLAPPATMMLIPYYIPSGNDARPVLYRHKRGHRSANTAASSLFVGRVGL